MRIIAVNILSVLKFILILMIVPVTSIAQDLKFKHLGSDQGLSQVSVQSIIQDSDGFMWFATQDGLNRYDGFHFKVFKNNPIDKNSISSNVIYSLFEDEDGLIYVGTKETGLSVYNRYTETFTNYKPGKKKTDLPSPAVRSICAASKDELLIGTEDGLAIFNKKTKTFETVKPENSDKVFYIMKVFKTSHGKLLIAAPRYGIYEYNASSKKLTPFYVPAELNNPDFDFYKIALTTIEEKGDFLFAGSFKGGIYQLNKKTGALIKHIDFGKENESLNQIKDIKAKPNSDKIFIATESGLISINLKNEKIFFLKNNKTDNTSLASNFILTILFDQNQTLWLGTYSNGVDIELNDVQKFSHYKIDYNSESNATNCFLETYNKYIYIGNDYGLFQFNSELLKISKKIILNSNKNEIIQCLHEDKKGKIWIGTINSGIFIYDPETNSSKNILEDVFENLNIVKIVSDINGFKWIATNNGLFSINPNNLEYKKYTIQDGITSNNIYTVFFDKEKKNIWLGTNGGGICILDFITEKPLITILKHDDNKNSISSNIIYDIIKDNNNIYWIASNNGLNCYDFEKKQFKIYLEADGLCNNTIWTISKDVQNNLWLATTNGLSNFNPKKININGSSFKNYNLIDGLQGNEFIQGAIYTCSNGSILVGGLNGFNYFNPKDIKENNIAPKSFIYSFSRQGKEIQLDSSMLYKKHIELPYNQNYFSFELIAQNYIAPEKTKFMYQLVGKDNEWSTPSNVRYVSYTGLEGGTYTFKVKACNSDGIWNESPYQITIKIIPPWYKTIWFYLLASVFTLGSIFGFVSYRTNLVKKENKRLEQKVEERTHELAEKNRDITSSIEYAKRIQEAILPAQELIFSRFKNAFILYRPKDIVSGDFYWFEEIGDYKIIATVDCTGHGVPGAFMSMIGHNLLNQIVSENNTFDPGFILQELNKGIQAALKQGQNQVNTNDGMDVSMLALNTKTRDCFWAGAFRSLVIISETLEIEKIEGNKYSVGGAQLDSKRIFSTHVRTLKPNDTLYMFTDGYADQFGGDKGKKFMVKRFHDHLLSIYDLPMDQQKEALEKQFESWKGGLEQVDDVLVIGVRV